MRSQRAQRTWSGPPFELVTQPAPTSLTLRLLWSRNRIVGSNPEVKWARVSREGAYAAESTMWLDPRRFNLHQIHAASDNGCALLDIMIPPYNKYVDLPLALLCCVWRRYADIVGHSRGALSAFE